MTKKKGLVSVLLLIVLIELSFIAHFGLRKEKTHLVELGIGGFYPTELTIKKGDSVKFTTKTGEEFWPATDIHPTHSIYSEFDQKQPISSNSTWTFKFTKEGRWAYHDHLTPTFKGLIIVSDGKVKASISFKSDVENCAKLDDVGQRDKCYQELVQNIASENDMDKTIDLIEKIYLENPGFENNCHDFMHKVGAVAFKNFTSNVNFSPSVKSVICGYGFYHGFLETLTKNGGGAKKAKEFCKFFDSRLHEQLPNILFQCYHGLAHGTVLSQENRGLDERLMTEPGKQICLQIAQNKDELFQCGTGIFDPIAISHFTDTSGLSMDKIDPFWLCKEQTIEEFKWACYNSIKVSIFWAADLDFEKAAKIIENIPEEKYAITIMGGLALPEFQMRVFRDKEVVDKVINFYKTDAIDVCRSLRPNLHLPCVKSVAYALTFSNDPSPRLEEGLSYCKSSFFSSQEKEECISSVFYALNNSNYPKDQILKTCEQLEEQLRRLCIGEST